jgi:carboxylate-amine ligase
MRVLAMRNHFCGLHVHVEIPAGISRVEIMNRCSPYLPLFLALSVSSPFWRGEWTGMHGYRLTGYDELPRTGIPPVFAGESDYRSYVETLRRMEAIRDESYLWWGLRPSLRFPTLELRICDSVTAVTTAVALASLFRCLIVRLATDVAFGPRPSPSLRAVAEENRWQIQCDGLDATIADVDTLEPSSARDAIKKLLLSLAPQAAQLNCEEQICILGELLDRETSADSQIRIWRAAESPYGGIAAVKAWLLTETMS